jgi:Terpene synthase family 2, C-terminal metal binding
MKTFMEMSEEEQRLRLSGTIPSVEEFWEYRLGSSAVCVTLAVNEYVNLIC